MQNNKSKFKIKSLFYFLASFFIFSFLFFNYSFSYSPYFTHPDLTEEMVKFFNLKSQESNLKISKQEILWLRKGAINEDTPPRWINHFYDPVHKIGWTGKHFGSLSEEDGYKKGADMAPKPALASIDWAENQEYQSAYAAEYGNQTWQKALVSYVIDDKESAFIALGHILHLVEDLSVPDHTRNDSHAGIAGDPGSPYEDYSKEYTNYNKLTLAKDLKNQNRNFLEFSNLEDYFEYLANYSNNNFFSEDTISNEEFNEPKLSGLQMISKEIEGNIIRRYLVSNDYYLSWFKKEDPFTGKKIYTTDDKYFVLPSYRSHLFPQAVLTGASVINQFFKEAEFYKQNPKLLSLVEGGSGESFWFNLKREPKLMAVNISDYYDMHWTGAKIGTVVLSSLAWNKTKQLAYETEQFAKETFFQVKSSVENGLEQLKQITFESYENIKLFLRNDINNQQAGLPIAGLNQSILDSIQNNKAGESQINETVSQTNETNLSRNVLESNLANARNGQDALVQDIKETNQNKSLSRVSAVIPKIQTVSQKSQSLAFQNKTLYIPGFGGGEQTNSQFLISNPEESRQGGTYGAGFQNESQNKNSATTNSENNTQNQNSASSTNSANSSQSSNENNNSNSAISTNQNGGNNQDHASTTENSSGNNAGNNGNNNTSTTSVNIILDTTPPSVPQIISPVNLNQTFMTSQITFEGTAEASSTLLAKSGLASEATTTVSLSGNWSLTLSLNEGTTTIDFFAIDESGNISSSTSASVFVDSIKPLVSSFQIAECADSLSAQGESCLTATTTLNLSWTSENKDIDYYELSWSSDNPETTVLTSTSTTLVLNEGEHNFSLRVRDKSGNWSDATTTQAEISAMPVVINEIAWMGTKASDEDEWIELYNRTSKTINLSGFRLYSSGLGPYIIFGSDSSDKTTVNSSIAPHGYYLIERTNDETVGDISADWYGSFNNGLEGNGDSNWGENLYLAYNKNNSTTTLDYVSVCQGNRWCGGLGYSYRTMERVDPDVRGDVSDNWFTNILYIKNGRDKNGNAILGTPKSRNSANYLIFTSNTITIKKDTRLTKKNSPYFVYDTISLPTDTNLIIEPGVVIKLLHPAYFFVAGNLEAVGNENDYIIFTSFYDDEYGGDLDKDLNRPSPRAGDWRQIVLQPTSSSTINYVRFRYGGSAPDIGGTGSMLKILRSSPAISNSIFEYSFGHGIKTEVSKAVISNNRFLNNYVRVDAAGIYIESGSPIISGNVFYKNKMGMYLFRSEAETTDNVFNENINEAAVISVYSGIIPIMRNNSGSLNGKNGITLSSIYLKENTTSTLYSNSSLPYMIQGNFIISSSSSLIIKSGTVIKVPDTIITVLGKLIAEGDNSNDIIFTSLNDSAGIEWYGIRGANGATISLQGVTVKNGGRNCCFGKHAALYADKTELTINNSVFENNGERDVIIKDSISSIKNSEFRNTGPTPSSTALTYYRSAINLENVIFQNHNLAVSADTESLPGIIIPPIEFI